MEARPSRSAPTIGAWQGYSLAERDRRWQAVRERAARAGLDGLFVPLGNGTDARYLTQLRAAAIVLPSDGRPPVVVTDRGARNEWVPEPRHTSRAWAEPMVQALLDAGLERARIGVVGLLGGTVTHVRAPDGVVVHSAYAEVVRRLPHATFADATDVVGYVRYVKSAEEIGYLRRAAEIAEAGVAEMVAAARPGADAADLYARVMERLALLASEYYPLALSIDPLGTPAPRRYADAPLGRRLTPSTLIDGAVHAVWGAQVVQAAQPVLLGPVPAAWAPAIALQQEAFAAGLARLTPGTTFGALLDAVRDLGAGSSLTVTPLLHGCGLGDDGPLVSPRARTAAGAVRIETGNVFVWKPRVTSADGRIRFAWGGPVLVTARGGEPLFQRAHGLASIA